MSDGQKTPVPPIPKEDPQQSKEDKEKGDKASGKDELIQRQKESERPRDSATDDIQGADLSEEDRKLQENLTMLVERIVEANNSDALRKAALDALSNEIRTSTSSMTAIPKPLKFLRPHYETLREFYQSKASSEIKPYLADVLSVLSMVMQKENERLSLAYRLAGSKQDIGMWGHEYLRHLAAVIAAECAARAEANQDQADVQAIVDEIIPFFMKHNAETDAIDLLLEVDRVSFITSFVTTDNYTRVTSYMLAISEYMADAEDKEKVLRVALDCLVNAKQNTDALRVALKLNDREAVTRVIEAAKELAASSGERLPLIQLCFMLGSHRYTTNEFDDDSQLRDIVGNVLTVTHYKHLAQDLDVKEAKSPEDIYKSYLAEGGPTIRRPRQSQQPTKVDSAKQNLASSFVNAFVNGGFGNDTLMLVKDSDWLHKNKDHGMMSAAASLGLLLLWDLDTGFDAIDKYTHSSQNYIKAGAVLAEGILSCGVTSEMDASLALLTEHIESNQPIMRVAAAFGLGIAYAGTGREDVQELLVPLMVDSNQPMEVAAMATLALGMVFMASANEEISGTIIEMFMERSDTDLQDSMARVMSVGLALLFLGRQEQCTAALEAIRAIDRPIAKFLELTVDTAAYFASGNVLKIQQYLSVAGEHLETETKDKDKKEDGKDATAGGPLGPTAAQQRTAGDSKAAEKDKEKDDETGPSVTANMHQAVAVLGLALVTCGEELGAQMALRSLDNLIQYGDVNVRRAVPLALAMLSVSHPRMTVIDTLSKLSHDTDQEVSQTAILCLGFVGAGTNNSRIANLLRSLATYYTKEPNHLFLVRIAQGLLHAGKGLLTLSPFHADHSLYIPSAAAGLIVVLHAALDMKNTLLSKRHYLLYAMVPAIRPRMLMTLDEDLKPVPVKVKYGTSVDTVGQAGKPKTITGFQTHQTPILLSHGERAELATDEWIPLTNILEDIVIVRKNPDAKMENE